MIALKMAHDTNNNNVTGDDLKSTIASLFTEKLQPEVDASRGEEKFATVKGIYLFQISSPTWTEPHYWTLDLKQGRSYQGKPPTNQPADTTYVIEAEDLIALLNGRFNSAHAYLTGKLKLLGNTAAAFKFQHFINETLTKQFEASSEMATIKSTSPTSSTSIPASGLKCDVVFSLIRSRLAQESNLVERMPFTIQINITKNKIPAATWIIDTKVPGGRVVRSGVDPGTVEDGAKPDATLTIEDDDYIALLFGRLNPQRAFMKGLVKVKGNIMLLQRLDTLWNTMQKTRHDPELPFVKDVLLNTNLQAGLHSELAFFDLLPRLLRSPPLPLLAPSGTSIRFSITQNGLIEAQWHVYFSTTGHCTSVKHQARQSAEDLLIPIAGEAELELILDDEDFVRLSRDPGYKLQEAIATSRVTINGDHSLVPALEQLFSRHPTHLQSKL